MKSEIGTEYSENSYANNQTERAMIRMHRGGREWQVVSGYALIYFLHQSKSRRSKNKINQGLAKQLPKDRIALLKAGICSCACQLSF